MSNNDVFLEIASRIGDRLVKSAIWDRNTCTWEILVRKRGLVTHRIFKKEMAPGTLYRGSAGIALFLAELFNLTNNKEVKKTSEGALQYVVHEAKHLDENNFGFYSGRVGIAYTLNRASQLFENVEYQENARQILYPLLGNETNDRGLDVISGAAGAIPALLKMAETKDNDFLTDVAIKLGEHLINQAHMEPVGWSWGTMATAVRHLTGFAHGASGIGFAFLELYRFTGRKKYLYAAEQAFLYERQFFNKQISNWPDFRHLKLGEYYLNNQFDALKKALHTGKLPSYNLTYMTNWCHGAPGIGLTRTRAYELLRQDIYKDEAMASIHITLQSLKQMENYSLCHGRFGNCELLLYAAKVLNNTALKKFTVDLGLQGWEEYEKPCRNWPCGTENQQTDSGLMLGEAGIGYFYLQLYSQSTPSVLFISYPNASMKLLFEDGLDEIRRAYIDEYFGRSKRIFSALTNHQSDVNLAIITDNQSYKISDVEKTYETLKRYTEQKDKNQKKYFEDAFSPERIRYELTFSITDFTKELLNNLIKPETEEIDWSTAVFKLSRFTRVLQTNWDWEHWLAKKATTDKSKPSPKTVFFILYLKNNKILIRQVDYFAGCVLKNLEKPGSLQQVVSNLIRIFSVSNKDNTTSLQEKIIMQIQHAYQANIVEYTNMKMDR